MGRIPSRTFRAIPTFISMLIGDHCAPYCAHVLRCSSSWSVGVMALCPSNVVAAPENIDSSLLLGVQSKSDIAVEPRHWRAFVTCRLLPSHNAPSPAVFYGRRLDAVPLRHSRRKVFLEQMHAAQEWSHRSALHKAYLPWKLMAPARLSRASS